MDDIIIEKYKLLSKCTNREEYDMSWWSTVPLDHIGMRYEPTALVNTTIRTRDRDEQHGEHSTTGEEVVGNTEYGRREKMALFNHSDDLHIFCDFLIM